MSIATTNTLENTTAPKPEAGPSAITLANLQSAFKTKCDPWIGIEIEAMIVDAVSGQPVDGFHAVYDQLSAPIQSRTCQEFLNSQIEHVTTPSVAPGHHRREISEFVQEAIAAAAQIDACLLWSGSHPTWQFDRNLVSDCQRSHQNVARYGDRATAFATCSMHCHVQVPQDLSLIHI